MKKSLIVFITVLGWAIGIISCNNRTKDSQKKPSSEVKNDTVVSNDSIVELDPMSPYWYDKDQTEVTFSEKKDTLYRFPRIKMGGT